MKPILSGLCVLNTRPTQQAEPLTKAIQALGGKVISCPALEIRGLSTHWEKHLPSFDNAIFTSQNAVNFFFDRVPAATWPQCPTFAIGQATAKTLSNFNIHIQRLASQSSSEGLLALPELQQVSQQHFLLIKGQNGRTVISTTLTERGAVVTELAVYERVLPKYPTSFLQKIWRESPINIILFTSQQAMEQLFTLLGEEAIPWLRKTPCLVVSERLAHHARMMGIKTVFVTKPESLVEGLIEIHTRNKA